MCAKVAVKVFSQMGELQIFTIYQPVTMWQVLFSTFSSVQFSSVAQSCTTLWPHESQHTRPPCPSPTTEFTQTHVHRVGDAIQPSHPLSSSSPPAPNPSQHQGLFQRVNASHQVAKVLEFSTLHETKDHHPSLDKQMVVGVRQVKDNCSQLYINKTGKNR